MEIVLGILLVALVAWIFVSSTSKKDQADAAVVVDQPVVEVPEAPVKKTRAPRKPAAKPVAKVAAKPAAKPAAKKAVKKAK